MGRHAGKDKYMGNIAIRAERLFKRYRRGVAGPEYYTFREALVEMAKSPFRRYRGLTGAGARGDGEWFWALNDVSFEIERGGITAIIGPNGSGKSTLLRILSRITRPTRGLALMYGRVGCLLEVGTGFHSELTGRENIYLSGAIRGMKKAEIRGKFDEIVDFSGMKDFLDTPVKWYSSGMYVRLAFAVAANLEPELLLVDEVLAVGDAEFQEKCLRKMQDVAEAGRTVVVVSHNMAAVQRLCTSGLLLVKGEVIFQTDDVEALIHAYFRRHEDAALLPQWRNNDKLDYDNEWFIPIEFYLGDEHGNKIENPISGDSDTWVHIKGDIRRISPSLSIGYALYYEEGQVMYWTRQTDAPLSRWWEFRQGPCHLKSGLPTRLFNEGTYRMELIASVGRATWLCRPLGNAPEIFFTVRRSLSEAAFSTHRRPGILAPLIEWTEQQL